MWWLWNALLDGAGPFFSIQMPRLIVVKAARLGLVMRLLQGVVLLLTVSYGLFMGGCYTNFETIGDRQMLWFQPSDERGHIDSSRHCVEPMAYWYTFGNLVSARPSGCKRLPWDIAFYDSAGGHAPQGEASGVFFPTFIQDEFMGGWVCDDGGMHECNTSNHSKEEFFMIDAEEQFLAVFHGFKVDVLQYSTGDHWAWGSSVADGMVTHILKQDGSECQVGGRSIWTASDAREGITGRIREWLACAGASLDSDPQKFLPPSEGEATGLAPHLRTMGFSMQLVVDYKSKGDGVQCILRVNIVPRWTVRTKTDWLYLPGRSDSHSALRKRTAMGVAVSFKTIGAFKRFDISQTVKLFVDSLVLLWLPLNLMQMLLLYCMGDISRIYRRARATRLNVYRDFHCAFAKIMVAVAGFRSLVGAELLAGPASGTPCLTMPSMLEHLRTVFDEPLSTGEMQAEELHRMVALVFRHLDKDGSGEVGCSEFVHSAVAHDTITVDDAVRFFGSKRQEKGKGSPVLLKHVLCDSERQMRKSVKSLSMEFDSQISPGGSLQSEQSSSCEAEPQFEGDVQPRDQLYSSDMNSKDVEDQLTGGVASTEAEASKGRFPPEGVDKTTQTFGAQQVAPPRGDTTEQHHLCRDALTPRSEKSSGRSQGWRNLMEMMTHQPGGEDASIPRGDKSGWCHSRTNLAKIVAHDSSRDALTPRGGKDVYHGQAALVETPTQGPVSPKGQSVTPTPNPTLADDHLQKAVEDVVNTNWSERMTAVRNMVTDLEGRLKELESKLLERPACKLEMRESQTLPVTVSAHWEAAENIQQQQQPQLQLQRPQQAQQKQAQQQSFLESSAEADKRTSDCQCGWLAHFEDLQRELSDLERRFEKFEIKDMEERISKKNWSLLPPLQQTSHIRPTQARSLSQDVASTGRNEKGTCSDGRSDIFRPVDADHHRRQGVCEGDQRLAPWHRRQGVSEGDQSLLQPAASSQQPAAGSRLPAAEVPVAPWVKPLSRHNLGNETANANCFCIGQDRGKHGALEALKKWADV